MQVTCALLLALPLLAGCDPSRFMLTGKNPIQCRIYGPVNSVEHTPDITVLEPDGVLGLSVAQLTEFRFVMNTTLLEGEGMSIMLRPIAQESVVDSGIVFHFSKSHSYIDSAGHLLLDLPQVHMRNQGNELITVLSENHELELTIGCDTILKRMTSMMETDDIVLKADPTSKVRITGADWQEIPNSDEKSVTHLTME
jgi:hypothetical protein